MTQNIFHLACDIHQRTKRRLRDLSSLGEEPVGEGEFSINISGADIIVTIGTLNKLRNIVKDDIELELDNLQKQFDVL